MKLVCIKEFGNYEVGKHYEYWVNFGGLNHIVKDHDGDTYPFDGPSEYEEDYDIDNAYDNYERPYIFDYFQKIEDYREGQLNKII